MNTPLFHAVVDAAGHPGEDTGGDALFPWWSFTKTVIAICALRLAQDGIVALHAPVPGRPFTLNQALTHMSGLGDYGRNPAYRAAVARGDAPWSRDRMLADCRAEVQACPPGTDWGYSNIGYMFAVEELEARSGEPLSHLMQRLVLAPLGLHRTRLAETQADFAQLHWPDGADYHPGWVYHRCLMGPVRDAAQLVHALARGHLLPDGALSGMLHAIPLGGALPGRPWTQIGYGIGVMAGTMGPAGRAFGHSGSGPFSSNAVYHFPDLPHPVSVAVFGPGPDESRSETMAQDLALRHGRVCEKPA